MDGLKRFNPNVHNRRPMRADEWAKRFAYFNSLELGIIQAQYEIRCVWSPETTARTVTSMHPFPMVAEGKSTADARFTTPEQYRDEYMFNTANGNPGWYIYRIILSGGKIIRPGEDMPMTMPVGEDTLYAR